MGQPKFNRRKYDTPNHPWQGDRIKAEHEVVRKFGLKNKREIWKAQTRLREIRGQARTLVSRTRNPDDDQAKLEADLLLQRLHRQGYVGENASLNEVLGLDMERILNRRLQSQVYLKGMARTMKQARQFVSHGAIRVGDRRVTVPSYVVRREEEALIAFDPDTPVADDEHPVRPKPEGYDIMHEAAAPTPVQEDPKARPDQHPAERDEAPAEASEEPNMTENAPAQKTSEAPAEEAKESTEAPKQETTETPEAPAEKAKETPEAPAEEAKESTEAAPAEDAPSEEKSTPEGGDKE